MENPNEIFPKDLLNLTAQESKFLNDKFKVNERSGRAGGLDYYRDRYD